MTDAAASAPPSLLKAIVAGIARHAMTAIAGMMLAHGMIATDQQAQVVSIGASIAVWGLGVWWSAQQKTQTLPQPPAADDPPH